MKAKRTKQIEIHVAEGVTGKEFARLLKGNNLQFFYPRKREFKNDKFAKKLHKRLHNAALNQKVLNGWRPVI
jgi:hypothetical protein